MYNINKVWLIDWSATVSDRDYKSEGDKYDISKCEGLVYSYLVNHWVCTWQQTLRTPSQYCGLQTDTPWPSTPACPSQRRNRMLHLTELVLDAQTITVNKDSNKCNNFINTHCGENMGIQWTSYPHRNPSCTWFCKWQCQTGPSPCWTATTRQPGTGTSQCCEPLSSTGWPARTWAGMRHPLTPWWQPQCLVQGLQRTTGEQNWSQHWIVFYCNQGPIM